MWNKEITHSTWKQAQSVEAYSSRIEFTVPNDTEVVLSQIICQATRVLSQVENYVRMSDVRVVGVVSRLIIRRDDDDDAGIGTEPHVI